MCVQGTVSVVATENKGDTPIPFASFCCFLSDFMAFAAQTFDIRSNQPQMWMSLDLQLVVKLSAEHRASTLQTMSA